MEGTTRHVLAFPGGDRRSQSGNALWEQIPAVERAQATFSTAQEAVSTGVVPPLRPRAITTLARTTNSVVRFNGPGRQRISRLGRATVAFSKNLTLTAESSRSSLAMTTSPEVQHSQESTTVMALSQVLGRCAVKKP
jgi:IS1 family transposase